MDAQPIAMPTPRELVSLRASHRSELAQRLHDVRAHGPTSDDDDRLAVLEDAAIDRARIAQLADLVRCATVLDDTAFDGAAGLGSTVEVADEAGRTRKYRACRAGRGPGTRSVLARACDIHGVKAACRRQ